MTLVIHVNNYTGQIVGGYWMFSQSYKKDGKSLTTMEVISALAAEPDARVSFLTV